MAIVSDVMIKLRVDMSEVNASMKDLNSLFGSMSLQQSMNTIVSSMSSAGDALVDFGKGAYTGFAEFERGVSKVSAMANITGDSLDLIRDKAMELGGATEFTSKEVIDAFQSMALAGWREEEMLSSIDAALNLATISGLDFGNVTSYMINAIAPFGLAASDAEKVVDLFAKTATSANFNVNDLAKSFEYVAPIAGAMGYKMEDINVALALLANNGLKGSKAGTSLRKILTDLNGAAEDGSISIGDYAIAVVNTDGSMRPLVDVLKEMSGAFEGLSESEKASTAESLVGKTGLAGFLSIMNSGAGAIDEMTANVYDYNGASQEMSDIIRKDAMGSIDDLSSAWDNMKIIIGQALDATLRPVIDWLVTAVQWFNNLDEGTQNIIITIGAVTGITLTLGAALLALVPLITAVSVVVALGLGWLFLIPVAVGLIVAGLWLLIANWDAVAAWFSKTCENVKQWFSEAGDWIIEKWTAVVDWFKGVPAAISTWFSGMVANVKQYFSDMAAAMQAKLEYFFGEFLPSLPMRFAEFLNFLLKAGIQMFEDLVNGAVALFNWYFEFLASLPDRWEEFWHNLGVRAKQIIADAIDAITDAFDTFITWCGTLPQKFKNACDSIADKASEIGKRAGKKLTDAFDAFITWCDSLPQKFKNACSSIADKAGEIADKTVEKFKSGISSIKNWFKTFFETIFDGVNVKAPHFTFTGSMNPLKWADQGVPKIGVDWYASGGIFSGAQVIGVGESGDEAVIPLNNRTKVRPFAQAIAAELGLGGGAGSTINIQQLVVREEADIRKVAQELYRLQQYKSRGRGGF